MFEDIYIKIHDPSELVQLTVEEISQLRSQYPQLPADYLEFLGEVGSGDLGNLVIYASPMSPAEVYGGSRSAGLDGILLFGDDMQGFCYGFDLKDDCRVVEIDPRGNVNRTIAPKFLSFVRYFLA